MKQLFDHPMCVELIITFFLFLTIIVSITFNETLKIIQSNFVRIENNLTAPIIHRFQCTGFVNLYPAQCVVSTIQSNVEGFCLKASSGFRKHRKQSDCPFVHHVQCTRFVNLYTVECVVSIIQSNVGGFCLKASSGFCYCFYVRHFSLSIADLTSGNKESQRAESGE